MGSGVDAQEVAKTAAGLPARAGRAEDEKAIGAVVEAFVRAFDAGDAKAVAETYSETAIVVGRGGASGPRGVPRSERITPLRSRTNPRARSPLRSRRSGSSARRQPLRKDERPSLRPRGWASPEISRFTAIYVKEGGKWLQAAVRDEPASDLTPHDRLKELEWLVGEWVNESQDAVVSTVCAWDKGGNFLVREFTMKTQGRPVLSGTQRIGWDPLKKQFKTWIFDSEGGHGEGHFHQIGTQWIVKVDGVGSSGQPATATNTITRLGKDRLGWQSADRTLGDSAVPGVVEFVIVRKPPEVAH